MKKKFLVASEGETDFEVVKAALERAGQLTGDRYSVKPIFPDARSKQHAGWTNLRAWLQDQAVSHAGKKNRIAAATALNPKLNAIPNVPNFKADKISAALALNSDGYDRCALIVQLDTDVAEAFMEDAGLGAVHICPLHPNDRLKVAERALDNWLGGHAGKRNTQIYYCTALLALETWILALHDEPSIRKVWPLPAAPVEYEHIHRPDRLLVELGYPKDSPIKLRKTAGLYKQYGAKVANALAVARGRSAQLDALCTFANAL